MSFGCASAPEFFRVTPQRPVAELLAESARQTPPQETGHFRESELVDLAALSTRENAGLRFDIRYATANNFLGTQVYESARAFLQSPAAEALLRVQARLRTQGWGLLVHDAYRPWAITHVFWEATPPAQRDYVADPATGSKHNRGCAVDVSVVDLNTGAVIPMPSEYDEFTERAHANYSGGDARFQQHRERLRAAMEAEGFAINPEEWWHYDYKDWQHYRIENRAFREIEAR